MADPSLLVSGGVVSSGLIPVWCQLLPPLGKSGDNRWDFTPRWVVTLKWENRRTAEDCVSVWHPGTAWSYTPAVFAGMSFRKLRGEAACHPVALGCDTHQALSSVISLKPLQQRTCTFQAVLCACWCCCTCCYCLTRGWRWWPKQTEAVAIRREMWQQPAVRFLQHGWGALAAWLAALFSNRLFFPCCSFVVLFYKRNQRADYSSLLGERKGRGDRCPELL